MERFVRTVGKTQGQFGVYIPKKMIKLKRWGGVTHVLIEDGGPDTIIIRRLLDGKAIKGNNSAD